MLNCLTIGLLAVFVGSLGACRPFENDLSHDIIPGSENAFETTLPPGTLAKELLTAKHFKSTLIEIQPVQGMSPSQESLNYLYLFLKRYLDKPRGLEIKVDPPIPVPLHPQRQTGYTLEDIKQIERRNRKHYTEKGRLAVYVLFLDWNSADDIGESKMLGQAYQESSIVIYKNTLMSLSAPAPTPPPAPWMMEATVILHEFGHLMGLVNMDNSGSGHEDANHPRHCSNPKCLMHYAAESSAGLAAIGGNAVPQLDADCEHDLQEIRAK